MLPLFPMLRNITNVVGISCRGKGWKRGIYVLSIIIHICIGNKMFCGGGGRFVLIFFKDCYFQISS